MGYEDDILHGCTTRIYFHMTAEYDVKVHPCSTTHSRRGRTQHSVRHSLAIFPPYKCSLSSAWDEQLEVLNQLAHLARFGNPKQPHHGKGTSSLINAVVELLEHLSWSELDDERRDWRSTDILRKQIRRVLWDAAGPPGSGDEEHDHDTEQSILDTIENFLSVAWDNDNGPLGRGWRTWALAVWSANGEIYEKEGEVLHHADDNEEVTHNMADGTSGRDVQYGLRTLARLARSDDLLQLRNPIVLRKPTGVRQTATERPLQFRSLVEKKSDRLTKALWDRLGLWGLPVRLPDANLNLPVELSASLVLGLGFVARRMDENIIVTAVVPTIATCSAHERKEVRRAAVSALEVMIGNSVDSTATTTEAVIAAIANFLRNDRDREPREEAVAALARIAERLLLRLSGMRSRLVTLDTMWGQAKCITGRIDYMVH